MNMTYEDLVAILEQSEIDLVRTISKNSGLVGYIAEEMCKRAQIDKKKDANSLKKSEMKSLYKEIQKLVKILNQDSFSGIIYTDEKDEFVFFDPFELEIHSHLKKTNYSSFNETVDEYFAKLDSKLLLSSESDKAS